MQAKLRLDPTWQLLAGKPFRLSGNQTATFDMLRGSKAAPEARIWLPLIAKVVGHNSGTGSASKSLFHGPAELFHETGLSQKRAQMANDSVGPTGQSAKWMYFVFVLHWQKSHNFELKSRINFPAQTQMALVGARFSLPLSWSCLVAVLSDKKERKRARIVLLLLAASSGIEGAPFSSLLLSASRSVGSCQQRQ